MKYIIELDLAPEVQVQQVKALCKQHNCEITGHAIGNSVRIESNDPINFFRLGRAWLSGLGDNGTIIESR